MRQLSAPFVVAAPEGACIRTSVFTWVSISDVWRTATWPRAALWARVLNIWAGPSASVR